jgi:hypothetical protein
MWLTGSTGVGAVGAASGAGVGDAPNPSPKAAKRLR